MQIDFTKVVVPFEGDLVTTTILIDCVDKVGVDNITTLYFDYAFNKQVQLNRAFSVIRYGLFWEGYPVNLQILNFKQFEYLTGPTFPRIQTAFNDMIETVALSIEHNTNEKVAVATTKPLMAVKCFDPFGSIWGPPKLAYVLLMCQTVCAKLKLDFEGICSRMVVDANMIQVEEEWYYDYRHPNSINRIEAFMTWNMQDPIQYADDTGCVSWDNVVKYVKEVQRESAITAKNIS